MCHLPQLLQLSILRMCLHYGVNVWIGTGHRNQSRLVLKHFPHPPRLSKTYLFGPCFSLSVMAPTCVKFCPLRKFASSVGDFIGWPLALMLWERENFFPLGQYCVKPMLKTIMPRNMFVCLLMGVEVQSRRANSTLGVTLFSFALLLAIWHILRA